MVQSVGTWREAQGSEGVYMVTSLGFMENGSGSWCEMHNRFEHETPYEFIRKWCPIHQKFEEVPVVFWPEVDDEESEK